MCRSILLMLGAGLLSSCFFVEVRGPVVGAIVTVEEWNYRFEEMETLGFSEKTLGPVQLEAELGSDTWQSWRAKTQLAFMGGTELPEDVVIRPKKLYVIRSGPTCLQDECLVKGMDYDPYGNKTLADTPITVDGQMFAFATGEQILQQSVRVSPLTTALYHYAEHFTANNFIIDELNAIAPKFVSDMDKNGLVDYADVLKWSRQRHEKQYRGDIRKLDVLAEKIRDKDDYFYRESWTEIVGSEGARQLMGQDYVGSLDGFDGYRLADGKINRSDGVPNPQARSRRFGWARHQRAGKYTVSSGGVITSWRISRKPKKARSFG
ncbi:hypothetical protein F0M18_10635 [Pseudohalioglobus sediminis]|uniref:Uncharacterized protein n=1 Tax=Pseudohalioglobus sediminis TaxID=2606449 RepID=A0A5B0X0U2_9GAMM|nr:hypothetical protein [Pseudohalioglobus sediminis]KAA1191971.1 hypothetical protein F0M18_10635 [Pseudohalioglobus sediminis]